MPVANLIWSEATLLSGGLDSCPTPIAEKCVGGVASVFAVMRDNRDRTGESALYVPEFDRHSPFVQMHPDNWNVNAAVLNGRFGLPFFVAPPSILTDGWRDLSGLRAHDLKLLLTNALVPPSNPWQSYVEPVHFDDRTGLAVLIIHYDDQPNTWEKIASALGVLDYVAETNARGGGCGTGTGEGDVDVGGIVDTSANSFSNASGEKDAAPCWMPVVVFDDFHGFDEFVAALTGHENPPALLFSTKVTNAGAGYVAPRLVGQTWVASFQQSSIMAHRFRLEMDGDGNPSAGGPGPGPVRNVTLAVHDLTALPPGLKDETYVADQEYLRSLVEDATRNDPIVGTSGFMPEARDDGALRLCMGGECPIGNLFNDAFRWATGADVSFTPSGGLRGPGWEAGNVHVSDLWAAHPFVNTLCTGTLSGVSIFKLLEYSTSVATFLSTYTSMGDRLLQVSGLRYSYNTLIEDGPRLISVDVWNETVGEYRPLERPRMYKFVSESWMCGAFDLFPDLLRGAGIRGEVPATINDMDHKGTVAKYLKELDGPYDTSVQGRLRNETKVWEPMKMVQVKERIVEGTVNEGLYIASVVVSVLVTLLVLFACWMTYVKRDSRPIKFAQIQFLWLLLVGLFLLSLGAIVNAIPPTDAACVVVIWLVNLGYTFELVPLIIKVAALNKLLGASNRLRRVKIKKRSLFTTVFFLATLVVVYLTIWTAIDPPKKGAEYKLTDTVTDDGETVVTVGYYCDTKTGIWWYISVGWNVLLLLWATVLAIQTRNMEQDFNESQTLAFMIYAHFFFVIIRVVTLFVRIEMASSDMARVRSIIFCADVTTTIFVYFFPKFFGHKDDSAGRTNAVPLFSGPSSLEQFVKLHDVAPGSTCNYAYPVHDLDSANHFYEEVIGCEKIRSSLQWQEYTLHGHQIVCHWVGNDYHCSDGVSVPHMGLVLTVQQFHELADRVRNAALDFIIKPHLHLVGQTKKEQWTMLFRDPSGNNLVFKALKKTESHFATDDFFINGDKQEITRIKAL